MYFYPRTLVTRPTTLIANELISRQQLAAKGETHPTYAKLHHQFIMASENSVSPMLYRRRSSYLFPSRGTPST